MTDSAPATLVMGSSPLTRGALLPLLSAFTERGLIPAHAGSTCSGFGPGVIFGAHPRSRGEHSIGICAGDRLRGSSPLTRGAPIFQVLHGLVVGLIPAHAGSTVVMSGGNESAPAHPRSRGEHDKFKN